MKKIKDYVKHYLKEVNDDGFSLLELVVAVGILAILSVVGLVAYSKITENARWAAVNAAAAEVYKGAFAYEANGDAGAAQKVIDEWMDSSKKDSSNSIVVENVGSDGNICIKASMPEHDDIIAYKGSGCETEGVDVPDDSSVDKTFYADIELNFDPGYDSYYDFLYKDSNGNVIFEDNIDPLYSDTIVYEGNSWEKVDGNWTPVIYYSVNGYMWWDIEDIKAVLECDVEEDETSVYALCVHDLSQDNKDDNNSTPTPTPTPVCEYTSEEAKIRAEEIYNETLPKAINMVRNNTVQHVDGKSIVLPGDEQNYTRKDSDENCGIEVWFNRVISTDGETYAFSDQSDRYAYMFIVQIDTDEKIENSSASYRHNHVGLINVKDSYENQLKASALNFNSPTGTTWDSNNKL